MRIPNKVFKLLNPLMIALLRSPLHGLMSKDILLLTYTGRRSRRVFTIPASYTREGPAVHCFTSSTNAWWRNLRGGATVSLHIRGEQLQGQAKAVSGEPKRIGEAVAAHLARHPGDASYYDISLDEGGEPDPKDLARASNEMVLVEIALC